MHQEPVWADLSIAPVVASPAGGRGADVAVGLAVFVSGFGCCQDPRSLKRGGWR
jgi:hypothetical protein